MRCLAIPKGEQGLPRLNIINTSSPSSSILVTKEGASWAMTHIREARRIRNLVNSTKDEKYKAQGEFPLPKSVLDKLKEQIEKATGVSPDKMGGTEHPHIRLSSSFTTGGDNLIPKEIRKKIREVRKSGLFHEVFLISEVGSWEVEYYGGFRYHDGHREKPKISGKVELPKISDSLLLVGVRQYEVCNTGGTRVDAFLLEAFNTRKLEPQVASK